MERTGICAIGGRQLRMADWWPVHGLGTGCDEPAWLQDMLKNKFKLGADARRRPVRLGVMHRLEPTGNSMPSSCPTRAPRDCLPGIDLDGTVLSQNEDETRGRVRQNVPFHEMSERRSAHARECARFCWYPSPVTSSCRRITTKPAAYITTCVNAEGRLRPSLFACDAAAL